MYILYCICSIYYNLYLFIRNYPHWYGSVRIIFCFLLILFIHDNHRNDYIIACICWITLINRILCLTFTAILAYNLLINDNIACVLTYLEILSIKHKELQQISWWIISASKDIKSNLHLHPKLHHHRVVLRMLNRVHTSYPYWNHRLFMDSKKRLEHKQATMK